ncbi:MAG TPA: FecR family protein [Puia sp.]|jgi:ferric-dicitrate binding protein FerR (iron transport regulator)
MTLTPEIIIELLARRERKEPLEEAEQRLLEMWDEGRMDARSLADRRAFEQWAVRQSLAMTGSRSPRTRTLPRTRPRKLRALLPGLAAATLLLCAMAGWLITHDRPRSGDATRQRVVFAAMDPGEDGSWLQTSRGARIRLDHLVRGAIVCREGGQVLRKRDEGLLVWEPTSQDGAEPTAEYCLSIGKKHRPWQLQLGDGSSIVVAGGSTFCFPGERAQETGGYSLSGAAFFDIKPDPTRPLEIRLPEGNLVRVLGTDFSLEAPVRAAGTRVMLFSGKLQWVHGRDSLMLKPGQQGRIIDGQSVVRELPDSAGIPSWANEVGYFDFYNTSFEQTLDQVARWYGCTISNPAGLQGVAVTGKMLKGRSPADVVRAIDQLERGFVSLQLRENSIVVSRFVR